MRSLYFCASWFVAVCLAMLASVSFPTTSQAQWSSDPTTNLAVADAASDQILAKVSPTSDGGCWISWYDGIATGFDVRIQRLDASGNEQFAHAGILVADRGFSSVQDYGLDTDPVDDSALLTFRDDRGTGVQITAAKVTTGGSQPWGVMGVQLTNTTAFVAAPKIAGAGGAAVVAWTQDADTRVQSLSAAGVPQWAIDVVFTPAAGLYSASDLHDDGTNAILSMVHQTGGFGSPRRIIAQKLDAAGAFLWGATPVSVFTTGSLQFGNFPEFVPDGSGGAVFSWYDTSSGLQCYVQRILSAGTEAFPTGGVAVSTDATRVRVSPNAAFDASTNEVFVFWEEQNSLQSQFGLYGQKFDVSGNRQWGSEGAVLVPVGAAELRSARASLASGGEVFVFWCLAPSFGQDQIFGAKINSSGGFAIPTFDVSSTPSAKSRLVAAESASGFSILAWTDERTDAGDVYAQNVNADGSLGENATSVPTLGTLHQRSVFSLGSVFPNPVHTEASLSIQVRESASIGFDVVDVSGRRIYESPKRVFAPGSHSLRWSLRDETGSSVPLGVYWMRVSTSGASESRRLVHVK